MALVVKAPTCQYRRHKRQGLNCWVGKMPRRRKWQPILVFLPGESHGERRLAGYSPRGSKESNMTEVISVQSVQSLSRARLFVTPMDCSTAGLSSITNSWSLLKLMSIESVMPSNHLISVIPFSSCLQILPSIRVFSNE